MLTAWLSDGDADDTFGGAAAADVADALSERLRPVLGDLGPLLQVRAGLLQLPPLRLQ